MESKRVFLVAQLDIPCEHLFLQRWVVFIHFPFHIIIYMIYGMCIYIILDCT